MGDFLTSTTSFSARKRALNSSNALLQHLHSIEVDSAVVIEVKSFLDPFGIPCVGNMRNGLWYAEKYDGGCCYFKSTDGHHGQWHFSYERANLELAKSAARGGGRGVLIVDSTKAGKRYPDSFTATVPIWCAVLNYVMMTRGDFEMRNEEAVMGECLRTPEWTSKSARSQMITKCLEHAKKLPTAMVQLISEALLSDGDFKPFRPVWACPDEDGSIEWEGDDAEEMLDVFSSDSFCGSCGAAATTTTTGILTFTPIVLLSVSGARNSVNYGQGGGDSASGIAVMEDALGNIVLDTSSSVQGGGGGGGDYTHESVHSWVYIPGAGDDEEGWAQGLTAALFWRHKDYILYDGEGDDDGCNRNTLVERRVQLLLEREKERRQRDEEQQGTAISTTTSTKTVVMDGGEVLSLAWGHYTSSNSPDDTNTVVLQVVSTGGGTEAVEKGEDGSRLEVPLTCDKGARQSGLWNKQLATCLAFASKAATSGQRVVVACTADEDGEASAALALALLCTMKSLAFSAATAGDGDSGSGDSDCEDEGTAESLKNAVRAKLPVVQAAFSALSGGQLLVHPPRWVVKEVCSFVARSKVSY